MKYTDIAGTVSEQYSSLKADFRNKFEEAGLASGYRRVVGSLPGGAAPVAPDLSEKEQSFIQKMLAKLRREQEDEEEAIKKKEKAQQGAAIVVTDDEENAGEDNDGAAPADDEGALWTAQDDRKHGIKSKDGYYSFKIGTPQTAAEQKRVIKKLQAVILKSVLEGNAGELRFYKGNKIDPVATSLAEKAQQQLLTGLGKQPHLQQLVGSLQIKDTRMTEAEPWRSWVGANLFKPLETMKDKRDGHRALRKQFKQSAHGVFGFIGGNARMQRLEKTLDTTGSDLPAPAAP